MREREPGLPEVDAETMGALKTLGQVVSAQTSLDQSRASLETTRKSYDQSQVKAQTSIINAQNTIDTAHLSLATAQANYQKSEITVQSSLATAQGQVDTAFRDFRTVYFDTLNTYLTSPNNTAAGQTQFAAAVTQEVNVLAQNVIHAILPVSGSTSRQAHGQPPIQNLINRRILSNSSGSLQGALTTAQPPFATTLANDQLYVLTAQNAISAACPM